MNAPGDKAVDHHDLLALRARADVGDYLRVAETERAPGSLEGPARQRPGHDSPVVVCLVHIIMLVDSAIAAEKSRPGGGDTSFVLGMVLIASRAANLLPEGCGDDVLPPEVEGLQAPAGEPLGLLCAAEELTRVHEPEDFEPGYSDLVVSLIDLIRDWTP
ncbi:hypothetical protein [Aquipuribacter hungaricus]|uniref:Uncharacterized protein n=1 Tax=Aquipuribacter hungaricus TaxID=545624 RepID=A0ABV7WK15_9MICO